MKRLIDFCADLMFDDMKEDQTSDAIPDWEYVQGVMDAARALRNGLMTLSEVEAWAGTENHGFYRRAADRLRNRPLDPIEDYADIQVAKYTQM